MGVIGMRACIAHHHEQLTVQCRECEPNVLFYLRKASKLERHLWRW